MKLTELIEPKQPITAIIYGSPGAGKSTLLGLIGEQSSGKTLVLDIDRTLVPTLKKMEVVKDLDRIDVWRIDNVNTWEDWGESLKKLDEMRKNGTLEYENVCVDNISELERCILSDLGNQGKNKGVPSQGDYQYTYFKMVNSLRFLKSLGVNVFMTAWETVELFQNPDGTAYSMLYPKLSRKIVDNVCGLCDVVGRVVVNKEGARGLLMEATSNVYAKNQRDSRKACKVEEFLN